jgi:CreA protein
MKKILAALAIFVAAFSAQAEEIGRVSTAFKVLGSNDAIAIEAFDDPLIPGVACHLSRAKKGGVTGDLGLATNVTEASIACRQVGPIQLPSTIPQGQAVFQEKQSILFKTMHVARFYDSKRNTLIYLVYSDKLIDGSPKNSISTVPVQRWN